MFALFFLIGFLANMTAIDFATASIFLSVTVTFLLQDILVCVLLIAITFIALVLACFYANHSLDRTSGKIALAVS